LSEESNLESKRCVPCEGGVPRLNAEEVSKLLLQVGPWEANANSTKIERPFSFPDFVTAMRFVNAVAEVSEAEQHHPDIFVHQYNRVRITLWTHAIAGLSENDFILAAKIDACAEPS